MFDVQFDGLQFFHRAEEIALRVPVRAVALRVAGELVRSAHAVVHGVVLAGLPELHARNVVAAVAVVRFLRARIAQKRPVVHHAELIDELGKIARGNTA